MKIPGFIFLGLILGTVFGQAPLVYSNPQKAYLADIQNFPLRFEVPIENARLVMKRTEGYLAKNMASFVYVSDHVIQAKVRRVFLTVSRLDLGDDIAEIEFYCSPLPSTRFNIAGVGAAGAAAILAGKDHKNREGLALMTLLAGVIAEYSAKKELERQIRLDLDYALFLSRITVKFALSGEYFPSATLEDLIFDNVALILLEEEPGRDFKKLADYSARREDGDPRVMVNYATLAKTEGATHFFLEYKEGMVDKYAFYKIR